MFFFPKDNLPVQFLLQKLIANLVSIRRCPAANLNPPDVSSFGPPGACITPSNVIIDKTVIFLIALQYLISSNIKF
jgi:hypothetical protein